MTEPLVSVVIPAYNCEGVLAGTIDCVLQQSYENIEILVVDDGSTDGTADVAGEFAGGGRIRYLRRENGGPGAARNSGIDAALGEYLVFADADDSLTPDGIEKRMALVEEAGDLELVYSNYLVNKEPEEVRSRFDGAYPEKFRAPRRQYAHGVVYEGDRAAFLEMAFDFWTGAVLVASRLMARVGRFRTDISVGEDRDMWIRMSMAADRIGYVGSPVACYNRSGDGLTGGDPVRYARARRELNRGFLERYGRSGQKGGIERGIRESNSWIYYDLGRHYRQNGETVRAVGNFMLSICYRPGNPLPYKQIASSMIPTSLRGWLKKMFRGRRRGLDDRSIT